MKPESKVDEFIGEITNKYKFCVKKFMNYRTELEAPMKNPEGVAIMFKDIDSFGKMLYLEDSRAVYVDCLVVGRQ